MCKAQHRCSVCVRACARMGLRVFTLLLCVCARMCKCLNMLSLSYITELQHTIESTFFFVFFSLFIFFQPLKNLCTANPPRSTITDWDFFWLSVNFVLALRTSDKQTCTWINLQSFGRVSWDLATSPCFHSQPLGNL